MTLSFLYTSQSLCNLTIIAYDNNGNNRDQIYCSPLSILLSTLSTLSPKFIFISGFSITTICITVFYCTCYYCILSTHHNNEEAENLDYLACCCCHAYFVFINSLSIGAGPNFNSICTIWESFFKIS